MPIRAKIPTSMNGSPIGFVFTTVPFWSIQWIRFIRCIRILSPCHRLFHNILLMVVNNKKLQCIQTVHKVIDNLSYKQQRWTIEPHMKFIVFSGLPGTGKSTLAEAVGRTLSISVFAKDWLEATLLR